MTFQMPAAAGRPAARPRPGRRGRILVTTLVVLALLVVGFVAFSSFYADLLWFSSVDKTSVFSTQLVTRVVLFAVFALLMAAAAAVNMWVAWRVRPTFRSMNPEQASLERYRGALEPFRRPAMAGLAVLLGVLAGVSAAAEWRTYLLWRNASDFGTTDPQFGLDIGFYTFTLPFWRFLVGFAFAVVVLGFLVAGVVHYLYGGLRLSAGGDRATQAAQAHLSVLIGLFLLVKAASYWLDRYELATKGETLVQGFTGLKYTDVNAILPAKNILVVISLLCAALFFANAFRRTWSLPLLGLALMVLSSVLIGWLYPSVVQYFQVRPSESVKESEYIGRNIAATRTAYGVDAVKQQDYAASEQAPADVLTADAGTLRNIRLIDPAVVSPTFKQTQQIRGFYGFPDALDVDRYSLDTGERGAVVAVRELNIDGLPDAQKNWINEKTSFTHGYGFVASYDNTAQSNGFPVYMESNIPPQGPVAIVQPRVYFGEQSPQYSIVGGSPEFDYPDDSSEDGQRNNTYDGTGGTPVGSLFSRLVFATKFQDTNILLSDLITDRSRIMWDREPRDRVEKVAPWLTLDGDPYPAVVDGRIVWIVDGYTTSNDYPYASRTTLSDATADSINTAKSSVASQPRDQVNYLRNSVKATVDAYDGTVTLYAWDESDPVLQTWSKAFPGTVQPRSSIPATLLAHLRYPEDLFKVQRTILSRYHVTDPEAFYQGQDFWVVPFDPTRRSEQDYQPPYYLTLQMPGTSRPSFSLTTTFAPSRRQTLASFMAVNAEPGPDYGTIRLLTLPRNTTIPGPAQVQNNFESNQAISSALTLLRGRGSDVVFGNLLSLPVGGGVLYVEPVYVRANTEQGYPLLRKVLAGYGSQVAFEDTVSQALAKVFAVSGTPAGPTEPTEPTEPTPTPSPSGSASPSVPASALAALDQALRDAQAAYDAGRAALARGDFAAYGAAQQRLAAALARAEEARTRLGAAPSASASPGASPSASASATASSASPPAPTLSPGASPPAPTLVPPG